MSELVALIVMSASSMVMMVSLVSDLQSCMSFGIAYLILKFVSFRIRR